MGILDLKDDFGAVGDGVADDTVALHDFFEELRDTHGHGRIPRHDPGKFYKTTQPIVVDKAITVEGPGPIGGMIMAVGLPAGSRIIDFDCLATDVIEHIEIKGLCLRSDNGLPGAMRVKNASYHHAENILAFQTHSGIEYTGTRTYSNSLKRFVGYGNNQSTVRFKEFHGGGHYTLDHVTFSADVGLDFDAYSVMENDVLVPAPLSQISVISSNFEGCLSRSSRVKGTVQSLQYINMRDEGGRGAYAHEISPAAGHSVPSLTGSGFITANSAGTTPWLLNGNVSGFDLSHFTVLNAAQSFFAELGSGVRNGRVALNTFHQPLTQAISAARPGVRVFGNENATGQCIEYNGAIATTPGVNDVDWTPTDASGAGLTFSTAAAKASKIGRMVFWQAVVVYPANSSGAAAVIGGLPFAIVTTPVVSGRSGGSANLSNSGVALGLMHGAASSSSVSVFNPSGLSAITNAALSGKELYLSGFYAT